MWRPLFVYTLADAWLADVSTRAKPSTLANYRSNVRTKILPTLGKRIVSDLTPGDVRRLHAAIHHTGAGDSSVSSAHRTLVTILEYGRAERITTENVAMLTPPRRSMRARARDSLTREQAHALLTLGDARWTLGLLTGLRSGEARALRWDDIDLDHGVATVSWSLAEATFTHGCDSSCGNKRAGNCPARNIEIPADLDWQPLQDRLILVRPKNGTWRQLPLTLAMVTQLRAHLDADTGPNPHRLLWHRPTGAPKTNTDDNTDLRSALTRAGIDRPDATTHWLRHSYVTLSEHAGIPWDAFSGVSGHGTTEASDPYRHILTTEGRRAVENLTHWVDTDHEP